MANSSDNLNYTNDTPVDTNVGIVQGLWRFNQTWREKLARRAAHASLGIPENEDMNISSNRNVGVTWKEIAAAGALGLGGWWMVQQANKPETPQTPPPAVQSPVDSEYEVIFYDKDGNRIPVPHISQRPAE